MVLLAIVFAVVGVIGLRFMAGETRRFHREHDALMTKHREVMDRVARVLSQSRRHDRNVT